MVDVDTIVIGSGAGGMTAALTLAQAGQKVLVLEQHDVPGGWCHSFTLGGYRFSPGVHYLGQLHEGGSLRRIYEGLGISGDLTFMELSPDGFDHVQIGAERFDIPKGRERFADRLAARFPSDAKAIHRHLAAVQRIGDQLEGLAKAKTFGDKLMLPWRSRTLLSHLPISLASMLDRHGVKDPVARSILSIQAGDHGLPPRRAPAVLHATVQHHYFNGGFYPQGGGFALPRAFLRGLKRAGGELRLKSRVERILVEGEGRSARAIGVRLTDGTEIRARRVVSNADPHVTYERMVGAEHLPPKLARRLKKVTWSTSALSLFLAVDMDARAAGLDSGNVWYAKAPDIDGMYSATRDDGEIMGEVPGLFLTTTTLKDPSKLGKHGHHTMEAFAFVDYKAFERWAKSRFGDRPADYTAMKQVLTAKMLAAADKIVPGLSQRVVFSDLGTPLTNVHYVEATAGNLYGTEKKLSQLGPFAFAPRAPIKDLYLAGASTMAGHGIMGATLSGLDVARAVLHVGNEALLAQRGAPLRVVQAEDPASWPADMRRAPVEAAEPAAEPALRELAAVG